MNLSKKDLSQYSLFQQLDDYRVRRSDVIRDIYKLYVSNEILPYKLFEYLKNCDLSKKEAGFILQYLGKIIKIAPNDTKFVKEVIDFIIVSESSASSFFLESSIFFFYIIDKGKLLAKSYEDGNLSRLKTKFLFMPENVRLSFIFEEGEDPFPRTSINFDRLLMNMKDGGELDNYVYFKEIIYFTCNFPFINNVNFLINWSKIKNKDFFKLIVTSSIFETNGKYIIYDPFERAKIDNFAKSYKLQTAYYKEIEKKKFEKHQKNLFDKFVGKYIDLSENIYDTGIIMVSNLGKIRINTHCRKKFNISEMDREFILALTQQFQNSGNQRSEFNLKGRNVEVFTTRLVVENVPVGYTLSIRDITEKSLIEKFTRHDIKNSLLAIEAGVHLIGDRAVLSDNDKHLVENSLLALNKLKKRFDQLFSLKTEVVNMSKIKLFNLILEPFRTYKPLFDRNGIELFLYDFNDTDIVCDVPKIQRVLENLLSNALKFSPRGTITSIWSEHSKESVYIFVSDQGSGIKNEYGDNIFVAGNRQSQHKKIEGSGFGLAICKKFMDLHKGSISYENNTDSGVKFTVCFPYIKEIPNEKV
ncbi:MAG: hypothetical protein CR982_05930 [Candidatus Cloacimonadota bacterium]|nr:MAG: hypothetical protein CR982_05930 [Candidatus Cloacimonadota bacterium]PIE78059.1 MAG: hypothetical protein CSA15_09490 [Candidatus Delongbacteria bacterium]